MQTGLAEESQSMALGMSERREKRTTLEMV
jgi:hypothetical protein